MKQWHVISGFVIAFAVVIGLTLWLLAGQNAVPPAPTPQAAVEVPRQQPLPVADTPPPAPQEQPPAVAAPAPPPLPPPALPEASGAPKEVTLEGPQRKFAHGAVARTDQ